jgi:CTP:molybdopterin cytidylyltransferase MocA
MAARMRREKGVLVFDTDTPVTTEDVNNLINKMREERERVFLGEEPLTARISLPKKSARTSRAEARSKTKT